MRFFIGPNAELGRSWIFRFCWRESQTAEHKALYTFSFVTLSNEYVAARISSDVVRPVELTSPMSATAELTYDLEGFAINDPCPLIRAVRHDHEALCGIDRKGNIPG